MKLGAIVKFPEAACVGENVGGVTFPGEPVEVKFTVAVCVGELVDVKFTDAVCVGEPVGMVKFPDAI